LLTIPPISTKQTILFRGDCLFCWYLWNC
jgi:hypothetical protein